MATQTVESAVGAHICVDGRSYLNFGGSSYLGLAAHPQIVEVGIAALREYGCGMPIPQQHAVSTRHHVAFEQEASAFFGVAGALFLVSGYHFGLVALASVRNDFQVVFYDEWAHYSLLDAIAASRLPSHSFRHLDSCDLEAQLKRHLPPGARPLVATDGLFSTWGEIAPLDELARTIAPYGGRLLVDESHSFGVLGPSGRGAAETCNLPRAALLAGGSLGKGFGVCGGVLPASIAEIESFRRTPLLQGAAAGLPAAAAMCAASLRYVRQHPQLLQTLRANVVYMKGRLRDLGLPILENMAPIAAFKPPSDRSALSLKQALLEEGIFVYHSTYMGAGVGGVIRCGIFADHTFEQIDRLVDALRRLL